MAWLPKEKEIEAMLSADGKHRYEYFIHRVCDTRKVWSLYGGGWASLSDGEKKLVPLWPHEMYAMRFKKEDWGSYVAKEIEIGDFLEQWIPDMKKDDILPAVFPVSSGSSVVVSLEDLEANLRYELAEHYGDG